MNNNILKRQGEEIMRVKELMSKLNWKLKDIEKLLVNKPTRTKRGLIDFGGDTLKFLFGTATLQDVQSIHEEIQALESRGDDITHAMKLFL